MKLTAIILLVLAFFGYHPTAPEVRQIDATIQAAHESTTTSSTIIDSTPKLGASGSGSSIPSGDAQPTHGPFTPFIIVIPNINQNPMPEEKPVEMPAIAELESPVAATILVENISKRPPYSNCYGNPVQSFWVRVFDKEGKALQGQSVKVDSTMEGFEAFSMVTDLREQGVGALLNVTMKGIDEGEVKFTFSSGSLSAPEQVVKITKVADTDRPAYCDPLPVVSTEETSNTPPLSPLAEARANAKGLESESKPV